MGGSKPLKKLETGTKNFVSDPGRVLAASMTMGGSEVAREGIKALTPKMPDLPNFNQPDLNQPTVDTAAAALAADAALQDQADMAARGRRGRASTILSSPQGLSGSMASSAKRTLLGA